MNIVEYRCKESGYDFIGMISIIRILMNIDAYFKRISWNIDAEGSGDADFEKYCGILM